MTCKINCCKDCSLTLVPNHWIFLMLTSFWTLVKLEITVLTSSTNYCCLNWNQCQLNLQVLEYEMHWLLLCPIEQKPICLCRVPITSSLVYFAITTLTILSSKVSEIFLPPCLGHFVLANFKAVLWKLEKKNHFRSRVSLWNSDANQITQVLTTSLNLTRQLQKQSIFLDHFIFNAF